MHLHPIMVDYEQPAKDGKPSKSYQVEVQFSSHCFTRGQKVGEITSPDVCYREEGETRIFDTARYELSFGLPGIIRGLILKKCYHTGRSNFVTVEMLDRNGALVVYEVFFALYSLGKALKLKVQSAYVRDQDHKNRPQAKSIRFSVILYNTLNGKAIKVQQ